jgi:membrane associated rhomboid family serine protease
VSRLSSFWIILLWLLWDVAMLLLGARTQVALMSHIGGFVAGFSLAMLCAARGWIRPTQDEQTLLQVLRPDER